MSDAPGEADGRSSARPALVLACALLTMVVESGSAGDARAGDGRDDEAVKEAAREKVRSAGRLPFLDLSFAADVTAGADTRWVEVVSRPRGGDGESTPLHVTWTAKGDERIGAQIVVQKLRDVSPDGKTIYYCQSDNGLGEPKLPRCRPSQTDRVLAQLVRLWTASAPTTGWGFGGSNDVGGKVVTDKCVAPTKTSVGPASFFASVRFERSRTETGYASVERTRIDAYGWNARDASYFATAYSCHPYAEDDALVRRFIASIKPLPSNR